jgi:hypothetical protein
MGIVRSDDRTEHRLEDLLQKGRGPTTGTLTSIWLFQAQFDVISQPARPHSAGRSWRVEP